MNSKNQRGNVLVIALIIIVVIIVAFVIWYFWAGKRYAINSSPSISTSPTATSTNFNDTKNKEEWVRSDKVIFNTTSSDTHKLSDGSYRMFFMDQGGIVYADSKEGINFSTPISTGITENSGKMISNPAVLEISPDNWIMVYELQPQKSPGQIQQKDNSPTTQRNLYLATSTDGKSFSKDDVAINSSKDKADDYFASVPDLVELPDGKIRMYYVSGGEAVGSAISTDNGKTWARESGYRLENRAVDPDVLVYTNNNGKTQYVMYYSVLTGPGNAIYKSTSADGLNWSEGQLVLQASDNNIAILDPDVVEIDPTHYRMFFGEMAGDSTSPEPSQPNLYYADLNQDIF